MLEEADCLLCGDPTVNMTTGLMMMMMMIMIMVVMMMNVGGSWLPVVWCPYGQKDCGTDADDDDEDDDDDELFYNHIKTHRVQMITGQVRSIIVCSFYTRNVA